MAVEFSQSTVRLMPLTPQDMIWLRRWDTDEEVGRLMGRRFQTARDVECWWRTLRLDAGRVGFGIHVQGRLVGDIELEHVDLRAGEAEVRICIGDRRYWGQGYGGEALRLLIAYAARDLGLSRLYLRVAPDNERAVRCYLRTGFRKRARLAANGRRSGHTELILMDLDCRPYGDARAKARRAGPLSTASE
jgi:RimJ/RimL family protein N-acetyltransferase